ncbi:hypothetical protein PDESU_03265 [Pontiella desulfatans]|uniref:Uncharacterized protein n=1 Tax=Pontiella desulfatans TaxID=2750659 RepID=A0A6C2U4F3_PONDE|nr:hypothetical protein [Pontiella desulfatans]VGO14697.1 hypothetical protein PDESU_03265 [Pontiella desulfatans]
MELMNITAKILLTTIIWIVGAYFGSTSSSDPAGEIYAMLIPMLVALVISIPVTVSIARTPVTAGGWRGRVLDVTRYVPLAIAGGPVAMLALVLAFSLLLALLRFAFSVYGLVLLCTGVGIWFFGFHRKKRLARNLGAAPGPATDTVAMPEEPEETLPAPEPAPVPIPAPVPALPPKPGRPRNKKPVCGVWAWVLPVASVPVGIGLFFLSTTFDYDGYEAWLIFAWGLAPTFLALCISPILAIVSLCRRERLPELSATMLILYAVGLLLSLCAGLT